MDRQVIRRGTAAAVAVAALVAAWLVFPSRGRDASFSILAGFAFGAILQRSRFCFASAFRDVLLLRDPRAALAVLASLAVGTIGYLVVFGAQMPDPSGEFVPPTAHIGRAGWHLVLGGLAFGLGMAIAGGCISGSLFRVGEGQTASLVALAGIVGGFVLGMHAWNPLWTRVISTAPALWLPHNLGYAGAALLQLGFIGGLAGLLLWRLPSRPEAPPSFLSRPWPAWAGGALVGIVATAAYFRTSPLGVTSEFGRLAVKTGLVPARLEGMDQVIGCRPATAEGLSLDGFFVLALVGGSFAAALAAGEFRLRRATLRAYALALVGGLFMGFGAMISNGCTVGTFLSGTMALSGHGWLFSAALFGGAAIGGLLLKRVTSNVVDVRGEICPVPALRVQAALRASPAAPLTVVGDHLPSIESMEAVAARFKRTVSFAKDADGNWVATFSS